MIENVLIQYNPSKAGGYGLYVAGASYARFERISIVGGKGILFAKISTYQEFIWLRQIAINGVANKSIEIKKGNNIYFTEVDVNDSTYGVYVHATASDIFTIFMQSIALVRCGTGVYFYAQNGNVTRFTMRDVNVFLKHGVTAIRSTRDAANCAADCRFEKNRFVFV